ncbi:MULTISPECIES: glycosyltransferase family 4 protein [unclassified Thioalkalivibrio]|uniref:glycosyltransferase family 4 protein n=1 Tax=unclassified Thioalkalivibrio TaxID=2621013 RepID=UPI0004760478|nr:MULTISPECIES: glycosyltransferase family 4 protein [unclassified Thioalkalivibrio]
MKVFAYMATPGGLTGAPRRLLTLASVLREEGIEMCIATPSDSELFRAAKDMGLPTVELDPVGVLGTRHGALFAGGVVFRLKALACLLVQNIRVAKSIRSQGADVVWIRESKGIAFGGLGAWLSRRPLVWDVDYELPSRGLVRWLHRLGLWAAVDVVFQYSAAPDAIFGAELAARYRHKFHAMVPGIDLAAVEVFRARRLAKEQREGEPFVILQAGSICDRKNQRLLIDALVQLRRVRLNDAIRVMFAGGAFDEEYADSLKRKVGAEGLDSEIEFLGWRADIHELMMDADLLVMPSRDEGVPNTVQEAMAIGVPVLVSGVGGNPEVVTDGDTGWLLDEDRPGDWAERIRWCLENRKELDEVGQRASAYARVHFGTQHWGSEYGRLIARAVGRLK